MRDLVSSERCLAAANLFGAATAVARCTAALQTLEKANIVLLISNLRKKPLQHHLSMEPTADDEEAITRQNTLGYFTRFVRWLTSSVVMCVDASPLGGTHFSTLTIASPRANLLLLCRVEVMLSDEDFRESDPEDRELFVENVLKEVGGRRYCEFTSFVCPNCTSQSEKDGGNRRRMALLPSFNVYAKDDAI